MLSFRKNCLSLHPRLFRFKTKLFNGPESVKILAIIFSHKPLVFTIIIVNFASVLNLNDDDIKRAD
jgi:hypothetical protein